MAAEWTDEIRNDMVDMYLEIMEGKDGTASAGAINEILDHYRNEKGLTFTSNSIRIMLQKQKRPTEDDPEGSVYVKKPAGATTASSGSKASGSSGGTAKLSKAEAQKQLGDAIAAINPNLVDNAIIEKLTGKAAQYFIGVILEVGSSTTDEV